MNAVLRDLEPGDAGWMLMRQTEHYTSSEGFDTSFEPLVARVLAEFLEGIDGATQRGWIAADPAGRRLGSVLCARRDADTAQLRLFFVEGDARRIGLGRRLLWSCIGFAHGAGYKRMVLWTHEEQRAACALYTRAGFAVTSSERTRSFGVEATVLGYALDLSAVETTRAALLQ